MPSLFKTIVAVLAVAASPALASVFVATPTSGTVCMGAQPCAITWRDDGKAPSLSTTRNWFIDLYFNTGSGRIKVQSINSGRPVDVSAITQSILVADPSIGPNGSQYSIGFRSSDGKYWVYSSKFTLKGMTGVNPPNPTNTRVTKALSSPTSAATPSTGGALKNDAASSLAAGVAVAAGVVALF